MSTSSKLDTSLGITWEKLDRTLLMDAQLCPQRPEMGKFMEKMFSRKKEGSDTLLRGDLYRAAFAPKGNMDSSSVKKYVSWMYHANDGIESRFRNVRDCLIEARDASGEPYGFQDHPEVLGFMAAWEDLIPSCAPGAEECEALDLALGDIIADIPKNDIRLAERLYALLDDHRYGLVMALLSVIASTLFCYGCQGHSWEAEDLVLREMFLPPLPEHTESEGLRKARALVEGGSDLPLGELAALLRYSLKNEAERASASYLLARHACDLHDETAFRMYLKTALSCGSREALWLDGELKAQEALKYARAVFDGRTVSAGGSADGRTVQAQKTDARACAGCQKVLRLPMSPQRGRELRGEAAYLLCRFIRAGRFVSPFGETQEEYLKESVRCGYGPALEENASSAGGAILPQRVRARAGTEGVCYCNSDNSRAHAFAGTVPESWGAGILSCDREKAEAGLKEGRRLRFLFIDDDMQKNRDDFLSLLQLISRCDPPKPEHCEIFLRGHSGTARPVIDTALGSLAQYPLDVRLLDDDLIAARQLLSCHPLFYPLRSVSFRSPDILSGRRRPVLNFIILGSGAVARHLVREAFWMMGMRENLAENRIWLVAADGETAVRQIKAQSPGMAKGRVDLDGIELPSVTGIDADLKSLQGFEKIEEIAGSSACRYFAVASGSDEENLQLAMRLREMLVRRGIVSQSDAELDSASPIAFLCRNDSLSFTSRKLVVEKESLGDQWFNTWSLIPFGSISGTYSWDRITGGTFRKLALCIHFQYSGVTPEDVRGKTEKYQAALRNFALRQYDQDSSLALALSMPCRIFQFQDENGFQICPDAWDITDPSVFSSPAQLQRLAGRIDHFRRDAAQKQEQAVAEWEHARWVRWMLSRGWLPASVQQAVYAFRKGNPRQQLFIARMHPCLCSYAELEELQEELKKQCGITKDFFTADLENIRSTKQLLNLEWLPE